MSKEHPIVAITGSMGAGTTTTKRAFSDLFRREGINAVFVQGDCFRRYDRVSMREAVQVSGRSGKPITHLSPEANLFDRLEGLFQSYSATGTGEVRHYVQDGEAEMYGQEPGTFTPWSPIPEGSDLLFYEGLHGGVVVGEPITQPVGPCAGGQTTMISPAEPEIDVAQWVDLLIGVVPIVNLEWIQKIHRDFHQKGKPVERVKATILRHLEDYVDYMVPQFSRTHINFQRVPLVDTSSPFIARDVPTLDESVVVIRFRFPRGVDFLHYLRSIEGSFMSRPNTIVVPGGQMIYAMELICTPIIHGMLEAKLKGRWV